MQCCSVLNDAPPHQMLCAFFGQVDVTVLAVACNNVVALRRSHSINKTQRLLKSTKSVEQYMTQLDRDKSQGVPGSVAMLPLSNNRILSDIEPLDAICQIRLRGQVFVRQSQEDQCRIKGQLGQPVLHFLSTVC